MKKFSIYKKILLFVYITLLATFAQAQNISLPTYLTDSIAPVGATLEYHNALPISASNLVTNPNSVDTGRYYVVYNFGTCYSDPTEIRVLQPICPLKTVNIANYIDVTNKPVGMEVTLHTALPVTDANKLATSIQPAGKYYVAYHDITLGCYSNPILYIVKNSECTNPDNNATFVNVPISGNLNTNDAVSPGSTYGSPSPIAGNPSTCLPVIAADGTYTFVCATPGVYQYNVPVCSPGQVTNCPTELLTITVLNNNPTPSNPNPPVANTDIASTNINTPINIDVKANDFTTNPGGSLGLPTITTQPTNGTASINPDGTIKYTPNTGFVGKDTVHYQVCDTTIHPPKCADAIAIITVLPPSPPNTTKAADDFASTKCTTPATGNALLNDTDPELNMQSTTPDTVVVANKGKFTLDASGHFTFTPVFGYSGSINFPYTVCDNGSPMACAHATIYILVDVCDKTSPDFNETWVNVPINGNVSTNDVVTPGSVYGNPSVNPANPSACSPAIAANGTYVFSCNVPGEYNFNVPVCPPGISTNCPTELLTITVLDVNSPTNPPIANTDQGTTQAGTPITIPVKANDKTSNPNGSLGLPVITDVPKNGTAIVNPDGTVKYTPNPGFVGKDTIKYQVCDTTLHPAKCDDAYVFIDVLPPTAVNTTTAADDYGYTKVNTPVSGNVLTNDSDPEHNTQTVTPINTTLPQGTIIINADGTYTFTPAKDFSGPVDIIYTVCDNGTPQACAKATLHILVKPDIVTPPDVNAGIVNTTIPGNVHTNDVVPDGTTYGTPVPSPSNPSASVPVMNPDGTYTFNTPTPGVYTFDVPVCTVGGATPCPTVPLVITISDPTKTNNFPVANTDLATTPFNTPVTVPILANDGVGNSGGTLGTPTILGGANVGASATIVGGQLVYVPAPGFIGKDTIMYQVCENPGNLCVTAQAIITVLPPNAPNTTSAADDYNKTVGTTPATGNVKLNDNDAEGNNQTVTSQNLTPTSGTAATNPVFGKGTFVLNSDGTYTFTAVPGFVGTVDIPYTTCDDGTPSVCTKATLHIVVNPTLFPDLTPVATFSPTTIYGKTNFTASVKIFEILGQQSTTGTINVYVSKNNKVAISFDPLMTTAAGITVDNSIWTFDATSNSGYYILSTNSVIAAGDVKIFGLKGTLTPGSANGTITISTIIKSGSGSEINFNNNNDADVLYYFKQ